MANTGMLRGADLRSARDERGPRANDLRGNRGTESLKTFYEDIGFSTTPEIYSKIMEDEAEYQGLVATRQDEIDTASSQYTTAQEAYDKAVDELAYAQEHLPGLDEAVDDSWSDYKSSLVGIRVMGPDDKIEATYYLPSDAASSFVGQSGIFASWHNSNKNLNVMIKDYRNQELHDILRDNANTLESEYKSKASSEIAEELSKTNSEILEYTTQLAGTESQLSELEGKIDAATLELETAVALREQEWADLRTQYEDRSAAMAELLGGMTIG